MFSKNVPIPRCCIPDVLIAYHKYLDTGNLTEFCDSFCDATGLGLSEFVDMHTDLLVLGGKLAYTKSKVN